MLELGRNFSLAEFPHPPLPPPPGGKKNEGSKKENGIELHIRPAHLYKDTSSLLSC